MDRLSISASVKGLLAASDAFTDFVNDDSSAPRYLKDLQAEALSTKIILSGLQRYVEKLVSAPRSRAVLIPVEDVVTVMTQLVLLYSEIEDFILSYRAAARIDKYAALTNFDEGQRVVSERLLEQLHRHKTSLSVVLQIIQWWVLTNCNVDYAKIIQCI